MAIFGLGNFGEGFVEGLATSANKALQDDIKRINLRAEKVADFQVKRTVEAQEKRKKDLEEIEDALREAEGMFDKDDPRAAAYAASLLEEQGSASALKAFTKQIKDSNVYKSGQSLANFMEMAEKDMPTGTRSDYANAFLGAPSSPTDYRLPESAASAGAGNLLDAIGLKPDVSGMVSEQVSEQMSAMGIAEQAEITVSLPSGTFMKEKFTMGNMTPSERLKYINEQLANENNTPQRVTELKGMLTKAQDAAYANGSDETKIQSLQSQLSRAEGTEREGIIKEISSLKRKIKVAEAETSTNRLDLLDARLEEALANAIDTGNFDEYNRMKKERDSIGKPIDPDAEIKEAENELINDVRSGKLVMGSDEYNQRKAAIRQDDILVKDVRQEKDVEIDLSAAKSIAGFMQTAIDNAISNKLTGEQRDLFNKASDALSKYGGSQEMFKKTDPVLYKQYMDIVAENRDIQNAAIENFLSNIPASNKQNAANAMFAAQSAFNYGGQAQAAAAQAISEVQGDGAAVTGGEQPVVGAEGAENDSMKDYPNDASGANLMIQSAEGSGISMGDLIVSAEKRGYGTDFLNVLRNKQMSDVATADSGMARQKNERMLATITHPIENAAANLFLEGKNPNEIAMELRQRYKNDPSYDAVGLTTSITKGITKVQNYSEEEQLEKEEARDAVRKRAEELRKSGGAGLMSRR